VAHLLDASYATIQRVDGEYLVLEAERVSPALAPMGEGLRRQATHAFAGGRAVLNHKSVHVPDIAALTPEDGYDSDWALTMLRLNCKSVMCSPLIRDSQAVGVLGVARGGLDGQPRPFSDREVTLMETFADQAVVAIQNARLFTELRDSNRTLKESLDQQSATADVLRAIASSPADLDVVLTAIAESAARLCAAPDVLVLRTDGEQVWRAASCGPMYADEALGHDAERRPFDRHSVASEAMIEGHVVHVPDIHNVDEAAYPFSQRTSARLGWRTIVSAPLLRDGRALGAISVHRVEPRAFSEREISLLQSFADQAVIAIENSRLFTELQERLAEQTATAEIMRVIAARPADLPAVLGAIADEVVRLCRSTSQVEVFRPQADGSSQRFAANAFPPDLELPETARPPRFQSGPARDDLRDYVGTAAMLEGRTLHIVDARTPDIAERYPGTARNAKRFGFGSVAAVPLLHHGHGIGNIYAIRQTVSPFSAHELALLETFADQASIAIENTRLFTELQEQLEQQTATSEVLRVIAESPTDLARVLDTICTSAAQLCDARHTLITRVDGDGLRIIAALGGITEEFRERVGLAPFVPLTRASVSGRSVLDRQTINVDDIAAVIDTEYPDSKLHQEASGVRSMMAVPLMRQGIPIGSIGIYREVVRPFDERQGELLDRFAAQAVIAIENTRLFQELQESNRTLTDALEQQTATAEVLRVIASTPSDVRAVFRTIGENAMRLCDAAGAVVHLTDGTHIWPTIGVGATYERDGGWGAQLSPPDWAVPIERRNVMAAPKQAILTGLTSHVPDLTATAELRETQESPIRHGVRAMLSAPLLRGGEVVGACTVLRVEPIPFTSEQISILETFTSQAVIAVENARLIQELQRRTQDLAHSVDQFTSLGEVTKTITSTLNLDDVLNRIVSHAARLSGSDSGAIFELDQATDTYELRATYRLHEDVVADIRTVPLLRGGASLVARAGASGQPVQIVDTSAEPTVSPLRTVASRAGIRAALSIPLIREGQILGGLNVYRNTPGEFSQDTLTLLQTFANQSALAIHNARLFKELEDKSHQLEEASRHKSQFLANMSHELRTPLNAILGYSELIADGIYGPIPEKISEVMVRVDKSGRHLLGLINAVLDLAKIEAGQLTLSLADYSLKELVHTVYTATESLAKEKDIEFQIEIAPDLPTGHGDERRLHQVLLNLVGNAIKFTDSGRVTIRASAPTATASNDTPTFLIEVQDTGPGIPPEEQDRIFEEFQQADASSTRAKGGTGLGLAIAKRIVNLHGGRIWISSTPGHGSTFSFTVPIRCQVPNDAP